MGLLEMALWIPVNEGRWGRGCDGKQIKVPFAACLLDVLRAKFCSLIGPPSIVGGTQSCSLQRDPPLWRTLACLPRERGTSTLPLGSMWADSSRTVTHWERGRFRTKGCLVGADCSTKSPFTQTEIISHNTDISQKGVIYMIKHSSLAFFYHVHELYFHQQTLANATLYFCLDVIPKLVCQLEDGAKPCLDRLPSAKTNLRWSPNHLMKTASGLLNAYYTFSTLEHVISQSSLIPDTETCRAMLWPCSCILL